MSKGWSLKQVGWEYDDLFEEGYRFNNKKLKLWCVISREKAGNENEALEYIYKNHMDITFNELK